MATFRLTTNNDSITGTSNSDSIEVPSNNLNFGPGDTIAAGSGLDTMLFERTADLAVGSAKFANTTGIDVLDVSASASAMLIFDNSVLDQSDSGTVEIIFDGDALNLDLRTTDAPRAGYVLNGTGTVTLYDVLGQIVTVADGVDGTVLGGAFHDELRGGTGNDTLTGNGGEDHISGGTGNDVLSGGDGYDVLSGGIGSNTLTGGAQSDTFVISAGETAIITDFATGDIFERIDLRALSGVGFTDLAISQNGAHAEIAIAGGTLIRLLNTQATALTEAAFVFDGDPVETLAAALGPVSPFRFTDGADSFAGGAGTDIFEIIGNFAKLSGNDTFNGGAGTDVLRVWGDTRTVSPNNTAGMTSVEIIDMSAATGNSAAVVNAAMVAQSDTGSLLIKHGPGTLFLDTETAGDADAVVTEGTGRVTLVNSDGQSVTVSDAYGGLVQGGSRDDEILGGGRDDDLSGGARHDVIDGKAGNDTIAGEEGADTLTGGTGVNLVSGGADTDRFIVTSGETLTITDFDLTDRFERIDLRAFAGLGFADLSIANAGGNAVITGLPNGTRITLNGVAAGDLTAAKFIFDGEDEPQYFFLSSGLDNIQGGNGDDIIDLLGAITQLDPNDTVNGNDGIDTLRIAGADRSVSPDKLAGLSSIEVISFAESTGNSTITVTNGLLASSGTGTITIRHAATNLLIDTADIDDPTKVIVEGTGTVLLRNEFNQGVRISDAVAGNVTGGSRSDHIVGGLLDDTIDGGDDNDTIEGGAGTNTVTGGAGTDRFVVTSGEDLTITDYDPNDSFERIDLRAFTGLGFGGLTISPNGGNALVTLAGGTRITLTGVNASALSAADFIFHGQTPGDYFRLSDDVDTFTGGPGNDLIDLLGNIDQLSTSDNIDADGGIDTLRVFGADRQLIVQKLDALKSVEIFDFTQATGNTTFTVTQALVDSSSNGLIRVKHGTTSLLLDTAAIPAEQVIVEGTGRVELRNTNDQGVTISNAIGGEVIGSNRADKIIGGAKADFIAGADGRDTIQSGAGNDTIRGGDHEDLIIVDGGGSKLLTGGTGHDVFKITEAAGPVTITDFDPLDFLEVIDLTPIAGIRGLGALSVTDTANGARITGGPVDITLNGVTAAQIDEDNFLFAGQDPLVFNVESGTEMSRLQSLLDDAPVGAKIYLEAGTYEVTETLRITRSDISLIGAGEGQTVFVTKIPGENASPTIFVQNDNPLTIPVGGAGGIAADAVEGGTQVQLNSGHGLAVGDILYLSQPNDAEYLAATGNTGWEEPASTPETLGRTYLREQHSRITAIDGDTVTLAEPLAYTFQASAAIVQQSNFLENVNLSGFTITGNPDWGTPDPFFFDTTMPEWESVAALELDGVENSLIQAITIINPAAHGFSFQRNYNVTADDLHAEGAHNKLGASGYHYYLQESFANTYGNLTSIDARHAVLTSSFSAEHYNEIHVLYTNRDINFHGSPDSDNIIVVDRMVQDYPAGSDRQWAAVQPGVFPEHPYSTIEDNDVTFKYGRLSERNDKVHAHDSGADINSGGGGDIIWGGDGVDTLNGGTGRDTLSGGAGRDIFLRDVDGNNDVIEDFAAGTGGDYFHILNTAYTNFGQLELLQSGSDVFLDFGPLGNTTFLNTRLEDFTAANFVFAPGGTGENILMRSSELFAAGTQGDDSFGISRTHLTTAHRIVAGTGFDSVEIRVTSFFGNLSDFATYSGVDRIDASRLDGNALTLSAALVAQADTDELVLSVGESGRAFSLNAGSLPAGDKLLIDGAREVQLFGDRAHTVFATDRVGVNITGDTRNDMLNGGAADDRLAGGEGRDTLKGGSGDDTLDGGALNDEMHGGQGSDTYIVDHTSDRIFDSNQWAGTDHVMSGVTFYLGKPHLENLTLTGTGNTRGFGNGLDNVLIGNDGDNRLFGNKGDDLIRGGAGNDTVEGWYGDDTLHGGAGNDRFLGGPGSDTYYITDVGDSVNESRWAGRDHIISEVDFALGAGGHIEDLTLVGSATAGAGNGLNNRIEGNALDNLLTGNKGQDTLIGGAGNDTLNGEAGGGDVAIGGQGNDTYIVNHSKDVVIETAGEGVDLVRTSAVFRMTGSHIENLEMLSNRNISGFGNELDNHIRGNGGSNQLDGGDGGADTLVGGGANDIYHIRSTDDVVIEDAVTGSGVADAVWAYVDIDSLWDNVENVIARGNGAIDLTGNTLDNQVIGNNAVNVLSGKEGRDILRGNGGPDQFVFDTALGADNVDHIVDFTHGGDKIMLSTAIFGGTAGALDAADFVAGTGALDASDRIIYDQASGRLWYDPNGSAAGGQKLVAVLDNMALLDADDFAFF